MRMKAFCGSTPGRVCNHLRLFRHFFKNSGTGSHTDPILSLANWVLRIVVARLSVFGLALEIANLAEHYFACASSTMVNSASPLRMEG